MTMNVAIYLTAAILGVIVWLIIVVTRRVIRTVPGGGRDAKAMVDLVAELKRGNDLAERRIAGVHRDHVHPFAHGPHGHAELDDGMRRSRRPERQAGRSGGPRHRPVAWLRSLTALPMASWLSSPTWRAALLRACSASSRKSSPSRITDLIVDLVMLVLPDRRRPSGRPAS